MLRPLRAIFGRLWHELAVPSLLLAVLALLIYLLGLEPWRDPAGTK